MIQEPALYGKRNIMTPFKKFIDFDFIWQHGKWNCKRYIDYFIEK